jgi:hypothetical protein
MATPWFDNVRHTHQLSVFATQTVTGGSWGPIFTAALKEFNRISSAMSLGVTFVTSGDRPDPTSMNGGANVQFHAASGTVHEEVLRNKFGQVIFEFTENVSGTNMHGLTMPPQWADDQGNAHQFRAYIYVPTTPQVNTGPAGKQKQREVGDGVKLFIAVHELIHACGLSNADHSTSDPDLFVGQPQPNPGTTPQADKLNLRLQPPLNLPLDPPNPPLFITARTAGLIKSVWG